MGHGWRLSRTRPSDHAATCEGRKRYDRRFARCRVNAASGMSARSHECLAIRIDRKLKSVDVIDLLSDLFILRGVPEHIRSDNCPKLLAKAVQQWIAAGGAKTACIAPGSPCENVIESFSARRRDELLDDEIFYSLNRAMIVVESCWRATTPSARTDRWATSRRYPRSSPAPAARAASRSNHLGRPWPEGHNELTFKLEPSVGADQRAVRIPVSVDPAARASACTFSSSLHRRRTSRCAGASRRRRVP